MLEIMPLETRLHVRLKLQMAISGLFPTVHTWSPRVISITIRIHSRAAFDFMFFIVLEKDGKKSFWITVAEVGLNAESVM